MKSFSIDIEASGKKEMKIARRYLESEGYKLYQFDKSMPYMTIIASEWVNCTEAARPLVLTLPEDWNKLIKTVKGTKPNCVTQDIKELKEKLKLKDAELDALKLKNRSLQMDKDITIKAAEETSNDLLRELREENEILNKQLIYREEQLKNVLDAVNKVIKTPRLT